VAVFLGLSVSPWFVGEAAAYDVDGRQPYRPNTWTWWYLWEPYAHKAWSPPYPETNKIGKSTTVVAEDGGNVEFALTVTVPAYTYETESSNTIPILIGTAWTDTQETEYPQANSLYYVWLHIEKIDPDPNCNNTQIKWWSHNDLPEAHWAENLTNGDVYGPPWPDWLESMAEFALSIIPGVAETHATADLMNDLSGYEATDNIKSLPWGDCGTGSDAYFYWEWLAAPYFVDHTASFNQVAFDVKRGENFNFNLGVRIKAHFYWQYGYTGTELTTLGPIDLYVKQDYVYPDGVGYVSLYPISDDDTTESSVALSWSQYAFPDASYYFSAYLVQRSTDGGTTWATVQTITSLSTTSTTVSGLQSDTTYWFRILVRDDFRRLGDPSNVQTATTDPSGGGGGGGGGYPPPVPLDDPGSGT
jgi:hypothetical protein